MTLFDYAPTDFPPDTAATGMPQVFGADVSFLFQAVLVLVVVGLVALWIGRKRESSIDREMAWNAKWGDLAAYNGERARGIQHTPEYDAEMAAKQEAFTAEQLERWKQDPNVILVLPAEETA